ncbi:MAG: type I pullulanase [Bacillota bacterium]|nr:type I pullulanase [Bacillota bacterium]HOA90371.1 type I pullulanase [Bacillota bacterium]HPT61175.1 type I pullulanase [Bacillota bacterium]HPZ74039.1 type I pullulanase [Bacillota bacterium]HQD79014.1 type I pullulanase [Bacillota bacterium]
MKTTALSYDSEEFIKNYTYNGSLGALWSPEKTEFRLWAPTAVKVLLKLGDGGVSAVIPMEKAEGGTWKKEVFGDLDGQRYNYIVRHHDVEYEVVDPYARAVTVNGQMGVVVDLSKTNPKGWNDTPDPELHSAVDAIVYEVHVRDFSISPDSGIQNKGLYLGFTELGTTTSGSVYTGVSHLKELGITHVQLLPIYDFATVDETRPFDSYNWGYDPLNFNAPEGSYATDPKDPIARIRELKQLIQSLRENGIRVVMDVVYNHTYYTEESAFNKIVPGYYYRTDRDGVYSNGSGCGNELKTERKMVRKFIVDSMCYWAEEYKIKGFRIDLMGVFDIETVNTLREKLHKIDPSILIYGEGWNGGPSLLDDNLRAVKGKAHEFLCIGVFNDDFRDAIKGNVFRAENRGFISGAYGMEESIKCGITAAVDHPGVDYKRVLYSRAPFCVNPFQSINYAEAHDNLTLFDKLTRSNPEDDEPLTIARQKLAGAVILLAQGIPFLHAGQEFCRTKFGDYNSYRSGDFINQIVWANKVRYYDVFRYYQGLIALRKAHRAFRLRTRDEIVRHLEFMPPQGPLVVKFLLKDHAGGDPWEKIVVLLNGARTAKQVVLPGEDWVIVADARTAGTAKIGQVKGSEVLLPRISCLVLVDRKSFEEGKKES